MPDGHFDRWAPDLTLCRVSELSSARTVLGIRTINATLFPTFGPLISSTMKFPLKLIVELFELIKISVTWKISISMFESFPVPSRTVEILRYK